MVLKCRVHIWVYDGPECLLGFIKNIYFWLHQGPSLIQHTGNKNKVQPDEISSGGQSLKCHPRRFSLMNPWSGRGGSDTPKVTCNLSKAQTSPELYWECFCGRYAIHSLLSMWLVSKDIRGVLLNVNLQLLKSVMLPALHDATICIDDLNFQELCPSIPTTLQVTGPYSKSEWRGGSLVGFYPTLCLFPGHFIVYWKRKIGQPGSSWLCIILNRYNGGRGKHTFSQNHTEMQYFFLNMHRQFKKKNTMITLGLPLALIRNSWAKPNAQLFLQRD